jgi:hypothetical protein
MPIAAAVIPAVIGAGASIYSANQAASSAKKAARQQAKGIQQGITESEPLYTEAQNYLSPYVQSGQEYAGLMRGVQGLDEESAASARAAYDRSPSARLLEDVKAETFRRGMNTWGAAGGGNSGRAIEDLSRRTSDVELGDYWKWANQGMGMYGTGANAAGTSANLAMQRGRDLASLLAGKGTAEASGTSAAGLIGASGTSAAGNYLANALGKTDFSQMFGQQQMPKVPGMTSPGYSSYLPGAFGGMSAPGGGFF